MMFHAALTVLVVAGLPDWEQTRIRARAAIVAQGILGVESLDEEASMSRAAVKPAGPSLGSMVPAAPDVAARAAAEARYVAAHRQCKWSGKRFTVTICAPTACPPHVSGAVHLPHDSIRARDILTQVGASSPVRLDFYRDRKGTVRAQVLEYSQPRIYWKDAVPIPQQREQRGAIRPGVWYPASVFDTMRSMPGASTRFARPVKG